MKKNSAYYFGIAFDPLKRRLENEGFTVYDNKNGHVITRGNNDRIGMMFEAGYLVVHDDEESFKERAPEFRSAVSKLTKIAKKIEPFKA